jgi:hypothetical protein
MRYGEAAERPTFYDSVEEHMIQESIITCPTCGFSKTETMPTDACQFFYECSGCGAMMRPKSGDCCVYCSYGSVPCPSIQAARPEAKPGRCCTS